MVQGSPTSRDDELLLKVSDWICTYYSLALIVLGCVCNPLAFIVFSRKAFRTSTISVYLRILAVSDLGAILNGLLPYFLTRVSGLDLRVDDTACVVSMYVYFFVLYTSSWTLVIVTTERVVSIVQPHRVHLVCSGPKIRVILAIFFTAIGLLSVPCPMLLYKDVDIVQSELNTTQVLHCAAVYVVDDVLPLLILDALMFAFVPCLLLILFNIIIVLGVIRSRSRVMQHEKRFSPGPKESGHTTSISCYVRDNTTETNTSRRISCNQSKISLQDSGVTSTRNGTSSNNYGISGEKSKISNRISRRSAQESSLTVTLVAVNVTFILCNFPATAWGFGPQFQSSEAAEAADYAIIELLVILMYTNNSLNFVLYCATGSKFRAEVQALFTDTFNRIRCRMR